MAARDADPGTGIRFYVSIDGYELGSFTGIDGLGAEYDVQKYEEGGVNGYVHNLPGRCKYQNIKLSRPLDRELDSSVSLAAWFSELARGKGVTVRTATVIAYGSDNKTMAQWHLEGVVPVKYTGPSFATDGAKVAIESVELAHQGFFSQAG